MIDIDIYMHARKT